MGGWEGSLRGRGYTTLIADSLCGTAETQHCKATVMQ